MKNYYKSKGVLMEFIFVIFIFAIAGSICIGIFFKAYEMEKQNKEINASTIIVIKEIEEIKTLTKEEIASKLEGSNIDLAYYDEDFNEIKERNDFKYKVMFTGNIKEEFLEGKVIMFKKNLNFDKFFRNGKENEEIISLPISKYNP